MFIIDILIYVFFAWVMYSLAKNSNTYYPDSVKIDKYLWWYLGFFTLVSAIRWNVGVDCNTYIKVFINKLIKPESQEFVWDEIVTLVDSIGLHFTFGMGLTAFLQIYLISRACKEHKYLLIWIPIVLFGGRYYLDLCNGMRQMVAACGFVFASIFIVDKKPVHFAITILFMTGFHHSSIILAPFYLLRYLPLKYINIADKRFLCLGIFLVCFLMGQTPSFQGLIKYIEPIVSSAGYEKHADFYAKALEGTTNEKISFGPIMLSFLFSSLAVIWYAPVLHRTYSDDNRYFNLWYFLSFIHSCGYFLVCNVSHMMIRPFQYFELFLVLMLALLLHHFHSNMNHYKLHYYALVFIIWVCTIVGVYKASGLTREATTYKTIFFHNI